MNKHLRSFLYGGLIAIGLSMGHSFYGWLTQPWPADFEARTAMCEKRSTEDLQVRWGTKDITPNGCSANADGSVWCWMKVTIHRGSNSATHDIRRTCDRRSTSDD